jgi:hypothetical protein
LWYVEQILELFVSFEGNQFTLRFLQNLKNYLFANL